MKASDSTCTASSKNYTWSLSQYPIDIVPTTLPAGWSVPLTIWFRIDARNCSTTGLWRKYDDRATHRYCDANWSWALLPAHLHLVQATQTLYPCQKVFISIIGGEFYDGCRLVQGWFVRLRDICDSITTAYPKTSTVESDFQYSELEKDDMRLFKYWVVAGGQHAVQTVWNDLVTCIKRRIFIYLTKLEISPHGDEKIACFRGIREFVRN